MRTSKDVFELVGDNALTSVKELGEYLGYLRLYYRGNWGCRWFDANGDTSIDGNTAKCLSDVEVKELNRIVKECVYIPFPYGCDSTMEKLLATENNQYVFCVENRYMEYAESFLLNFIIVYDTTYGNSDYPVRLYVYRNKPTKA